MDPHRKRNHTYHFLSHFLLSLLLVVLFVTSIAYLMSTKGKVTQVHSSVEPLVTAEPDISKNFDVTEINEGEKIGEMTVQKVSNYEETGKPTMESARIKFIGSVNLTGDLRYTPPSQTQKETLCMSGFDSVSLSKLPKMYGDLRTTWFCFDNLTLAKMIIPAFSKDQRITLVIDNYTIVNFPQEVHNTASLISLAK